MSHQGATRGSPRVCQEAVAGGKPLAGALTGACTGRTGRQVTATLGIEQALGQALSPQHLVPDPGVVRAGGEWPRLSEPHKGGGWRCGLRLA